MPGKPRVSPVGSVLKFGGVVDTKLETPRRIGRSRYPQRWYCSEQQLPIILHGTDCKSGQIVEGGMGAGKTTLGVMWTYLRWIDHLGQFREGAITAPTESRLDVVLREVFGLFPQTWYQYSSGTNVIKLCDGTLIRGVSTYRQSAAQGSRVQGYNWSWLFADELQDQIAEFINSIARLRSGREGGAPRLGTATAKDDPSYRDLKDKLHASGQWTQRRLLGPDSPFVHADHWEAMRKITTDRDYRRLVLAEDIPPESRLYNTFDRKENVRPIPLRARKVTSVALYRKNNNPEQQMLLGHDPGAAKAATVWLDAYALPGHGDDLFWWVRLEHFTHHRSAEVHATEVLDMTRKHFGLNVPGRPGVVHVRSQPLGGAEDKPDQNIKRIWDRVGLEMKFAQYNQAAVGCGQIKKESRIGMVNTLFCNAEGKRRLFIECDDRGVSVAPRLVEALEVMERDALGRPERDEKDVKHDKSDLPAALGYALWPFERESSAALRDDIRRQLG